jgi:hypothetical protein
MLISDHNVVANDLNLIIIAIYQQRHLVVAIVLFFNEISDDKKLSSLIGEQ